MSGGPKYEYLWQDDVKYKKPTKLSAPEYIFNLFKWVDSIINVRLYQNLKEGKAKNQFIFLG